MNFLSVCSGIEAASVAWHPLGWKAVGLSEIEPFPCAVLACRWPEVPNLGDMTRSKEWNLNESIGLVCGGTPCQAFSIAGLRKGLADPRGNLTLVFLAIVEQFRPRWVVWENVPGVLSDKSGAFGAFLGGLGNIGYGFAYRILDAQYFGVAQRRRRVFVVGHIGGLWQRAAAVLFERESLCGNSPPRRESGQRVAGVLTGGASSGGHGRFASADAAAQNFLVAGSISPTLSARTKGGGGLGTDFDLDGGLVSRPLLGKGNSSHDESEETYVCATITKNYATHHGRTAGNNGGVAEGQLVPEVAYALQERDSKGSDSNTKDGHLIPMSGAVRRLTPRECERLQGFPDDYTMIPWRGRPAEGCPDGPRYKALGNSMAVPVMAWIGRRIQAVDTLT